MHCEQTSTKYYFLGGNEFIWFLLKRDLVLVRHSILGLKWLYSKVNSPDELSWECIPDMPCSVLVLLKSHQNISARARARTHTHTYIHIQTYMHTYTHAHTHTDTQARTHTHTYTHWCTHAHTHTHWYTTVSHFIACSCIIYEDLSYARPTKRWSNFGVESFRMTT